MPLTNEERDNIKGQIDAVRSQLDKLEEALQPGAPVRIALVAQSVGNEVVKLLILAPGEAFD